MGVGADYHEKVREILNSSGVVVQDFVGSRSKWIVGRRDGCCGQNEVVLCFSVG